MFGLRAAQFSGLLQPAPAQQVHRHRVLRRRPQRVDARVGSIGRDIVAHDDPDARRCLFPFHKPGRSVFRLCAGRRRACDHLPRCRASPAASGRHAVQTAQPVAVGSAKIEIPSMNRTTSSWRTAAICARPSLVLGASTRISQNGPLGNRKFARLPAGGNRIRTFGPPWTHRSPQLSLDCVRAAARPTHRPCDLD